MKYKLLTLIFALFFVTGCSLKDESLVPAAPDLGDSTSSTAPVKISDPTVTQVKPSTTVTMSDTTQLLNLKPNQKMNATFKTNLGSFTVELYPDKAPKTVANFVGLAEGTQDWVDPKTSQVVKGKPLYNGVIFHRVIPDFMIQGGDPLGMGTGGPGYKFADEANDLDFSKTGILAMANSGPNTNGSQFFITVAPTPWLTGKHTIFGAVTSGMEVVEAIVGTPTGPNDKPTKDVTIESITITRK